MLTMSIVAAAFYLNRFYGDHCQRQLQPLLTWYVLYLDMLLRSISVRVIYKRFKKVCTAPGNLKIDLFRLNVMIFHNLLWLGCWIKLHCTISVVLPIFLEGFLHAMHLEYLLHFLMLSGVVHDLPPPFNLHVSFLQFMVKARAQVQGRRLWRLGHTFTTCDMRVDIARQSTLAYLIASLT